MSRATWIADRLRAQGLRVVEHPGWQTRGSRIFNPRGVVCHHTASRAGANAPALGIVVNGRHDLPGPLAHIVLARDGTCIVVAAGRANHAGAGGFRGLQGNSSVFGIEAENDGRGERWTVAQLDAYPRVVAALLAGIRQGADACCGHREWAARRKIDPAGIDMNWMRDSVATILAGGSVERQERVLGRGDDGSDVRAWQQLLVGIGHHVAVDGDFGPATEAATRLFQEGAMLTADGIVGPATRRAMKRARRATASSGETRKPPKAPAAAGAKRVLGRGDNGTDVRAWQKVLGEFGERVAVDGDFGPATEAATRRIQRRAGVTADGLVGPATRAALRTLRVT